MRSFDILNDTSASRPPLSRAAPILAVGVALVLIGGFIIGIFIGRRPAPVASAMVEKTLPSSPDPRPAHDPLAQEPLRVMASAVPVAASPAPSSVGPSASPPEAAARSIPVSMPVPQPTHDAAMTRRDAARMVAPSRPLPQPVSGGRWVVQLGAFHNDDHAKLLVDTLAYHGQAARIAGRRGRDGRDWFFVQTPGYVSRDAAAAVARHLAASESLPTFVHHTLVAPGS
jgi:cell division protein FtsN